MLENILKIELHGAYWERYVFPLILVLIAIAVLTTIVKLFRSVEVSKSGKVIVKYHSPITWLKRYNNRVAEERAAYSDRQQSILSFLIRGNNFMQALGVSLFGLLFSGLGLFVIIHDPSQIKDKTIMTFLIIGILVLALGIWLFTKIGADDPYR